MSPALVHGNVDRWLLDHEDWIAQGGATRLALCEDWRKVAVEFGAGHPAAIGCLTALVREAWGISDEGSFTLTHTEGRHAWTSITDGRGKAWFYDNANPEAERLVSALEAAPQGES
jgi:hypothetical protein